MGTESYQPNIVYSYSDSDGSDRLAELRRGGDSIRRGSVIERESSRSSPDTLLPHQPIPGQSGLLRESCGEDIPAFFCTSCGHPIHVGSTCNGPSCERCWPAAVKREVVEKTTKLDGLRRRIYAANKGRVNVDFNHVVASLPTFKVDSEHPVERFLLAIKEILESNFDLKGFLAIFHPYRIKEEYRKPVYDHGGAQGQGDMRWKDVLNRSDWMKYVKFDPHFHLFFPLPRGQFDYRVCEAIESETGILFHRIEKSPDDSDDHRSVSDFEDLVRQVTYVYSHAGVSEGAFTQRMKGWLHTTNPPGDMEERALAAFCDAAPKLLGQKFSNVADSSCGEDVPSGDVEVEANYATVTMSSPDGLPEVRRVEWTASSNTGFREGVDNDWDAPVQVTSSGGSEGGSEAVDTAEVETERCGGDIVSISTAQRYLDDDDWCSRAVYAHALRASYEKWQRLGESRAENDGVTPPPSEA